MGTSGVGAPSFHQRVRGAALTAKGHILGVNCHCAKCDLLIHGMPGNTLCLIRFSNLGKDGHNNKFIETLTFT
jgi:hypothetical protein